MFSENQETKLSNRHPAGSFIPYSRQTITESDIAAVVAALKGDFLTTGPMVEEFENRFASYVGARYAVAVCNGTAALHLAMLVAGVASGDRVVITPNTFVASANCAAYVGAIPDFVDINPDTGNLSAESLVSHWSPDIKAVIAVDYGGMQADMPSIAAVARSHGAIIIEDACHAIGGKFLHGKQSFSIGGHPWADITTFSFHPVKTLTTGEGGMLVTDNPQFATNARLLRSHGIVRDKTEFLAGDSDNWHYQMQKLGFNYRLTDFQSALGISQLDRLDQSIQRRQEIVTRYNQAFAQLDSVQSPPTCSAADHPPHSSDRFRVSWHLYPLQIDFVQRKIQKEDFVSFLTESQIGTRVMYMPVYLHPWYQQQYGYRRGKCPQAELFYQRVINLPLHCHLSDQQVDYVIRQVLAFLSKKTVASL